MGIKEASGNLDAVSKILRGCDIAVLSGDDALTLPMIAIGAQGVISTTSNVVPALMKKLVDNALKGNIEEARQIHLRLFKLMKTLFIEGNPTPVKYSLRKMKLIGGRLRRPLVEVTEESKVKIDEALRELELI